MDSTTDKEYKDYPKWTASHGPSYFRPFLRLMSEFMMRVGLFVFSKPNVAELPPAFPRKEKEVSAFTEEYGIDNPFKYKQTSMKAYGYLARSVRDTLTECLLSPVLPCYRSCCGAFARDRVRTINPL